MRGDIYRLRGPRDTIGHEQQGRRYAVALQSNDMILSTCIVAPTSTSAYPYVFRPEVSVADTTTRLMLDQLRAVEIEKAIGHKIGHLQPDELSHIDRLLPVVLGVLWRLVEHGAHAAT